MVARLFRLRLALLVAEFRGSFARGLSTTLVLLLLFTAAVAAAVLPELLMGSPELVATFDAVFGAVVLGGAFLVPVFENRKHLEPRQFAHYPAKPGAVAASLMVTTVASWPFLLLATWAVALGVTREAWHGTMWLTVLVLLLVLLLAMASARVVSALSKLAIGSDRAGVMRAVGTLLLIAVLPVAVFAIEATFGGSTTADVDAADVLSWTPFGAPFAGLWLFATGDETGALVRFGIALLLLVVLLAVWPAVVRASNERIERPVDRAVARRGLGWFERFPARPAQVIGARALTYWARDPRYRIAFIAIPIAPVVMILAFWVAGADLRALALLPLPVMLLLLGWSLHNDVAMDSTAIWVHVASGIRGREDRAGRLVPVLLIGLPLAIIGSSLTVTVLGDWRVLPALLGMNIGVLLVSAGVASVFSALMPYPTTRPGDSPFVQPQWSGSGSGTAQILSIVTALVLAVPPVWFALVAVIDVEFGWNLGALLFGLVYGLIVLAAGVLLGGRVFRRSAPELIAITQVFD